MRLIASLALAALLAQGWPAAVCAETVAQDVFAAGLLKAVQKPALFRYRYEMRGRRVGQPFVSEVRMEVREVAPDGGKQVFFDLFEGASRRQFGPMVASEQNPLVIVFLQRDVAQMERLTGGAAGYFQKQVRSAFNAPAEAEKIEIEVAGRKLPAARLVIRPFAHDPNVRRFPEFKDKAYEFVVAQDLPGGIYRLAARTPDPAGGDPVLEESMTFEEVLP